MPRDLIPYAQLSAAASAGLLALVSALTMLIGN